MTRFAVRMDVLLSMWNNGFCNSSQQLDAKAFWSLLLVFAVLATTDGLQEWTQGYWP